MKKFTSIIMTLTLCLNTFGQSISNKDLKHNIDDLFQSYSNYDRFIGSVLISQDDTIIYQKSFGYADVESQRPNTAQSIFSIASVTKTITGVAIMKLVDDGALTLDTPISTYFPRFIPKYSKDITVRHLLNHSSGMQANIGRIDDEGNGLVLGENEITMDELIELFQESQLKFEPGTGYEYNNFGYTLLANIIEKVSGQSYADYLEQSIFIPAGMKNSSVDTFKILDEIAFPHTGLGLNAFKKHTPSIHLSWIKGAGNLNATAIDLYNFMRSLNSGILLKPESVDKLYNVSQPTGINDTEYGLGWSIEHRGGEKWINHSGLLPGSASIMGFLPEKNIKIIILSNATSTKLDAKDDFQGKREFVSGAIIDNVIAAVQGKRPELLPMQVNNSNKEDYNQSYDLDDMHSLTFKKQGNNYTLESTGSDSWSIFTYAFSKNAKEDNKASEIASFFANAFSTQDFNGLSDFGSEEMKTFFGSEDGIKQLKGIWSYFLEQAGAFKSYNIYNIEGENTKTVNIRFHFEKNDVGIVLSINKENLIQGMFNDDTVKTSHVSKVVLTPIGKDEFFINGHQNGGMQDLRVSLTEDDLVLIDNSIKFNAKRRN